MAIGTLTGIIASIFHFRSQKKKMESTQIYNDRTRYILMVLIGVLGLLLKSWFSDSIPDLIYCYLGNFSVSFAVYFLTTLGAQGRLSQVTCASIALLVVEGFELTDGFGFMSNVYDPFDLLANALGVLLAYLVDKLSFRPIGPDPG